MGPDSEREMTRDAEILAALQCPEVGLGDVGLLGELVGDPVSGGGVVAVVKPVNQAKCKEVLAAFCFTRRKAEALDCVSRQAGHFDLVDIEGGQQVFVIQRVGFIARFFQVTRLEGVRVDNERATSFQIGDVGFEGGRIHRDQRVDLITGRVDVVAGEVELEATDAGE